MISGSDDDTLRLWNMSTYQCVSLVKNVYCCWTNALYQIDDNRVVVGHRAGFKIVNINKRIIESEISDESLGYVYSFLKIDNSTIICGCKEGIMISYNIQTQHYKIIKKIHDKFVSDLLLLDNNTFLSSFDKTIILWNY